VAHRRWDAEEEEAAGGVCHVHLWSELTGRWAVTSPKHTVPVGASPAELETLVYSGLLPPPPPRRRLAFAVQGEPVSCTLHVRLPPGRQESIKSPCGTRGCHRFVVPGAYDSQPSWERLSVTPLGKCWSLPVERHVDFL